MLHETGLLCVGATVTTGVVGSRTGIWKVYLAKAGSFCPAKREKTQISGLLIWTWYISPVHGHSERTIGNHSNVVQCVPQHFQMFTFHNICRHAVLPLSQWPSSCSGKTFSRAILWIISQYVHEQFFSVMSQIIIISYPACRGLGSSICQITTGQVALQFSLSFTLSFTSTGAQLSQLQGQKCWK